MASIGLGAGRVYQVAAGRCQQPPSKVLRMGKIARRPDNKSLAQERPRYSGAFLLSVSSD
jgi:hypothetical protein